ncbi:alpha/beta hydrolase fold domain-containing protein [Arthrobacter sp. NPDC056493]|uniref:alpha/beta hydrolase fold domain-containing protein n=1 Tax=Arthrobacter sp. NPDC056493 TaxID=3345839 RepID=UPI00366E3751
MTDTTVAGRTGHDIPVRDYAPDEVRHTVPLVWVHGGGFMGGGLDMPEADAVARAIAHSGRHVRAVDYRLVPMINFRGTFRPKPSTNRYPEPLFDVLDAYKDLASTQPSTRSPLLGGTSAGAGLSLSAATRLRDGDGPPPSGLALIYGTFHGRPATVTRELRSRIRMSDRAMAVFLGKDSLERMNMNYGGSPESLDDHAVFPGGGDLRGLPQTLVMNADRDKLRASGDALAQELIDAGIETTTQVLPNTTHGFLNKPKTRHFTDGTQALVTWMDDQKARQ